MNETPAGSKSRFSFFVESATGLKGYIEVALDDLTLAPDDDAAEGLAHAFAHMAKVLAASGFHHDTSFDKPAYGRPGFGAGKPEEAPPADLVVPEHCGEPMRYVKERPATEDKNAVAAHWDCRKGRGCAEARLVGDRKFPFTNWHLTKKADNPAGAGTSPPESGAEGGTAGTPPANGRPAPRAGVRWTDFWKQARELGLKPEDVYGILGVANQAAMAGYDQGQVDDAAHRLVDVVRERREIAAQRNREPALAGAGAEKLPFEP